MVNICACWAERGADLAAHIGICWSGCPELSGISGTFSAHPTADTELVAGCISNMLWICLLTGLSRHLLAPGWPQGDRAITSVVQSLHRAPCILMYFRSNIHSSCTQYTSNFVRSTTALQHAVRQHFYTQYDSTSLRSIHSTSVHSTQHQYLSV